MVSSEEEEEDKVIEESLLDEQVSMIRPFSDIFDISREVGVLSNGMLFDVSS